MAFAKPKNISEAEEIIDLLVCYPDVDESEIKRAAEEIAPGNSDVLDLLLDARRSPYISDDILQHFSRKLYQLSAGV